MLILLSLLTLEFSKETKNIDSSFPTNIGVSNETKNIDSSFATNIGVNKETLNTDSHLMRFS